VDGWSFFAKKKREKVAQSGPMGEAEGKKIFFQLNKLLCRAS